MSRKVKGQTVTRLALIATGLPWRLMRFYNASFPKAKGPISRPALRSTGGEPHDLSYLQSENRTSGRHLQEVYP